MVTQQKSVSNHFKAIIREGQHGRGKKALRSIKQSILQLFYLPENIYTFCVKSTLKRQHINLIFTKYPSKKLFERDEANLSRQTIF